MPLQVCFSFPSLPFPLLSCPKASQYSLVEEQSAGGKEERGSLHLPPRPDGSQARRPGRGAPLRTCRRGPCWSPRPCCSPPAGPGCGVVRGQSRSMPSPSGQPRPPCTHSGQGPALACLLHACSLPQLCDVAKRGGQGQGHQHTSSSAVSPGMEVAGLDT